MYALLSYYFFSLDSWLKFLCSANVSWKKKENSTEISILLVFLSIEKVGIVIIHRSSKSYHTDKVNIIDRKKNT